MTKEELKKAKEAQNAYRREWRRKNPDKVRETQARYWAKKAQQMEQARETAGGNPAAAE